MIPVVLHPAKFPFPSQKNNQENKEISLQKLNAK
jgi:hypothetical protein